MTIRELDLDRPDISSCGSGTDSTAGYSSGSFGPTFHGYSGEDVNTMALRLIDIHSLPHPFDWEYDAIPAEAQPQLGKMLTESF